jgi:hypothetical protein
MRPKDPQPLFVRTAEYLGEIQIDIRRIEMSSRYDRPPWKPVNEKQFDVRLSAFGPGTSVNRSDIDLKKSINRLFFSDRPDRILSHEIELKTKKNQQKNDFLISHLSTVIYFRKCVFTLISKMRGNERKLVQNRFLFNFF